MMAVATRTTNTAVNLNAVSPGQPKWLRHQAANGFDSYTPESPWLSSRHVKNRSAPLRIGNRNQGKLRRKVLINIPPQLYAESKHGSGQSPQVDSTLADADREKSTEGV